MSLTTAQQVRLKIQDQPIRADDVLYSDGMASAYSLPHRNVTSGTAYVLSSGAWTATGASFNASGFVVLSGVPPVNSGVRVIYTHSTFSEDEIGHFTAVGGSVNGAALEAVQALMFDGLKRARWSSPDGASYDDTAAMRLLNDLYDRLIAERANDAVEGGTFWNWSIEQQNY